MNSIVRFTKQENEDHWMSISDVMSGLMIIFLFIALSYMKDVVKEKVRMEQIAVTWSETQEQLYKELYEEFKHDLKKWKASLDRQTLSVRFHEPSILFKAGESSLTTGFQGILKVFFPRYIKVLSSFKQDIDEVRIEGHTSSEWKGSESKLEAYFRNMKLSQDRTREVLNFCINLLGTEEEQEWSVSHITANGLSSSKPILVDGKENYSQSRRVDFRVRTKSEEKIIKILKAES